MAVRVKGANPRNYTAEMVLEAAMRKRIKDAKYGIPLQMLMLDWNGRKKNYPQSKTKGDFDDVFITRLPEGGLEVKYRNPGSLEWMKDGLTGDYSAMCPVTEKNIKLLASLYYDNLWTIRDEVYNVKIKAMADEIDEQNKKIPHTFTRIFKKINPNTGVWESVEEETKGTLYDLHKQRREANFKDHNEKDSVTIKRDVVSTVVSPSDMTKITEKERELRNREQAVEEREAALGMTPTKKSQLPVEVLSHSGPGYGIEELNQLLISKLRALARDQFGIKDAFKMLKKNIIAEIIKIQEASAPIPGADVEPSDELTGIEEEAVTS